MNTVVALRWPKRARRLTHALLGRLARWQSRCGLYRVDRYLDVGGVRFYPLINANDRWNIIGTAPRRTLAAAQAACQRHQRRAKA